MANNPKLEIPVSEDPEEMVWVNGVVGFDDPKELQPQQEGWSPSYMYAIKSNGVDHVLFASPTFHKKIQETGAIKNTVIRLARMGEGTSTRWFAKYVSGPKREIDEEPIPGFDEPVDQFNAPTYRPETRESKPVNTQQFNSNQLEYESASDDAMAMFAAMLTDINNVMMVSDAIVRSNYPKEWDDLPKELREDLISNKATGNTITLQNQLRALVGGWNDRSDYAAFNSLVKKASNKTDEEVLFGNNGSQGSEEVEEIVEEPDDDRWPLIKSIDVSNPRTRSKNLAKAIMDQSDLLSSPNEAASIIKRFGYTSAGTDRSVHWQIANMVWLYTHLVHEGATENVALKTVATIYNHPEDLIDWFKEESQESSGINEEEFAAVAEELGGQVTETEDTFNSDDDELAF